MGRTGRSSARLGLLAALLYVLALPATARSAVRESPLVERATAPYRATTSCYDRGDWAALVDEGYPGLKGYETDVYGIWRYGIRQVALPARGCSALEGRRQTPAAIVSMWIFVLGHELTHAEQSDLYNAPWSRPFDEVEADCGGLAKFARIKLALGITRHLRPPPRTLTRCPLRTAKLRAAWRTRR
jgi:hypothetical protein